MKHHELDSSSIEAREELSHNGRAAQAQSWNGTWLESSGAEKVVWRPPRMRVFAGKIKRVFLANTRYNYFPLIDRSFHGDLAPLLGYFFFFFLAAFFFVAIFQFPPHLRFHSRDP
jgi:hypothetical protein